jgi:hypothetical protein
LGRIGRQTNCCVGKHIALPNASTPHANVKPTRCYSLSSWRKFTTDQFAHRSWFILLQTIKGRQFPGDNLNKLFGRLKTIQVGYLEKSVTNYSLTRCDIAEWSQQLHLCESLKPRNTTACRTHGKCKNFVLCDTQLMSSVPMSSAWNHGRTNSPNPYTSLFTELFKWNTTTVEPTETCRTTLRRHKYSLYGRHKDYTSKRLRNIIKSLPSFDVSLWGLHLSTVLSADYEHRSYSTTDRLYYLHSNH